MSGKANRRRRKDREARETQVVRHLRVLIDAHAYDDPELLEHEKISDDDLFDLLRDDVLAQVFDHFNKLRLAGADLLKHTVVVIGENPAYPGHVMVQTSCDEQRPGFELNDDLEPLQPLGIGESGADEPSDEELAEQLAAEVADNGR